MSLFYYFKGLTDCVVNLGNTEQFTSHVMAIVA